jgi:hypothetical protein
VLVTVELPPAAVQDGASAVESMVTWPDITARLRALYGHKVLPANAVLAARADERFQPIRVAQFAVLDSCLP